MTESREGTSLRLSDGSEIKISPAWTETIPFRVGDSSVDLIIKEIESESELDGFNRLTKYHYRGAKGAGRTIPLVVTASHNDLPPVLGFIELTTSFLVNSARQKVLDAAFSDPERKVGWARWDGGTARKWINCIARISRCVVFPEFRGLGLSSLLVQSAVRYARERWHVAGMRPVFIEITADMLRYWPFVEKAGFVYVGDTEGNEHRAAKDMSYLIRKAAATSSKGTEGMPRGGGGILSLQRSRAIHLRDVVDRTGLSLEEVIDHLKTSPDRLSDEEWILLHKVYRRPKPTYLRGLTPAAEEFLLKRAAIATNGRTSCTDSGLRAFRRAHRHCPLLDIRELTINAQVRPVSSKRSRRLQEAFGIVSEVMELPIIENLDLTICPSEVILVTGPSGSGKSLLLSAIQLLTMSNPPVAISPDVSVTGQVRGKTPLVGRSQECHPNQAPIDALDQLSMEDTLRLMAVSGLAEPQVLIRPSRTLSLGQRYRLALALGIANDLDLLLVDEFCEPLDQFSTAAVAKHLRREVTSRRMGAIVATSRADSLASSLQPDRILALSSDGKFEWRQIHREQI